MRFLVTAMSFNRNDWVARMRNLLEGVFGEYVKHRFTELPHSELKSGQHSWLPEVKRLSKEIEKFNASSTIKSGKKQKALKESINDLLIHGFGQKYVNAVHFWGTESKNFSKFKNALDKLDIDTDEWFLEMVKTELPTIAKEAGLIP